MTALTKQEFLSQLSEKLTAMPEPERTGILDYYEKHIQNTNDGDEATAIAKLGSPSDVANDVLAAYVKKMSTPTNTPEPKSTHDSPRSHGPTPGKRPTYWWAVVVLLIIMSPAIFGLAVGLGGGALGIFVGAWSVILAFAVSGLSFVGMGIVSAVLSVPIFFQDMGFGLLSAGIGLVLVGCGIFLIKLTICFAKWLISLVQMLIEAIFGRRRRDERAI